MIAQRILYGVGAAALLASVSCNTLDIPNPNAPDAKRALSDPAAIEAVGSGAIRTWIDAFTNLQSSGVLSTQANSLSSSWNNGNLLTYNDIDNPKDPPAQWNRAGVCATPCTANAPHGYWRNDPAASQRTSLDAFWGGSADQSGNARGGFYTSLNAANDALIAIRINKLIITDTATTKMVEATAAWMQGASLMMLALEFDKAYVVDENCSAACLSSLQYQTRKVVRDSAVSKLAQAATLFSKTSFTTPAAWTNGVAYTNVQLEQIANTMAAMTLALYPRDSTELNQVDWAKVATFASQGMSATTGGMSPVDFMFVQDGYVAWVSELMSWFDAIDTGRLHTRIAHLLDPATQVDPWPLAGNPQPNSADKRLGDGSFGTAAIVAGFGTTPKTAKAGTDYAWSGTAVFRPQRGSYHQSNIGLIRYDFSGDQDPTGTYGGYGPAPVMMSGANDLIWAMALMYSGSTAAAIPLIDRSHVTRGGLPSAATNAGTGSPKDGPCMSTGVKAKDGTPCSLWSILLYEQAVELPGQGPIDYFIQRQMPLVIGGGYAGDNSPSRVLQGLLPGTAREMPVTYKELAVKGQALYTWGGTNPMNSPTPP